MRTHESKIEGWGSSKRGSKWGHFRGLSHNAASAPVVNMEASLGQRVVRGPDWEWRDQDGGEGFVGTVAGLEEGVGGVIVQWDMGQRCRYRCGRGNKFDLRVLDCGPSGGRCGFCSTVDSS